MIIFLGISEYLNSRLHAYFYKGETTKLKIILGAQAKTIWLACI